MYSEDTDDLILLKKYKVGQKIGSGSFGTLHKQSIGDSILKKQNYAVKIEKKDKRNGQLQHEIKLYHTFRDIYGIARVYDYGYEGDKMFMVIDLLESSLEDLFQAHNRTFSTATVYNIGLQIISRLETIHRKGFLHRDIKANNFMIGRGQKRNTVYIIDFGLAKRYKDQNGTHIPGKEGKSLVGTARYASIASHLGFEQGRKDDLESLGYLLLYFLRGKLPWQGIQIKNKTQKYAQIGRLKRQIPTEQICQPLGTHAMALTKYFDYIKSLKFADEPNYEIPRKILREQLIKMKEQHKPFDWLVQKE